MKRFIVLPLLCAFMIFAVQTSFAQSRPRRVGQTPPPQQAPSPEPQDDTAQPTQTARPSQAPVLGGATRNSDEQQPAGKKKDAGPEEVGEGDVVKVDTTLVSIPVSVMDRDGKYIPNLNKENFRVWENGVEQKVAYFASTEKPFTVALMIDTSGSTRFKLEEIQEAAIAFVNQLRPDDRVMVVSFSDRIRVLAQPTNNRAALQTAIRQTEPGSGTRLYDAVDQVINKELSHVDGRKAIVLFTDGVDTTSKHATYDTTVRDAEELDALIYPVEFDTLSDMGILGPGGGGGGGGGRSSSGGSILDVLGAILGGGGGSYPRSGGGGYPPGGGGGGRRGGRGGSWPGGGAGSSREEYELADRYLHELARVSGARLYNAEQANLDVAFRSVAEELRRQYSLGYYPKNPPQAGERRDIKVRVDRPELVVRTRDSYVFQSGANTAQTGAAQPKPPVLKKDLIGKR
jgi:Ca-activated chloride channel homolog